MKRFYLFLALLSLPLYGQVVFKGDVTLKGSTTFHSVQPGFTTNQSTLHTTSFTIRGTAGKVVTFDWGDGSSTSQTLSGTAVNNVVTHDYSTQGSYNITLSGDLINLTLLQNTQSQISGDIANLSGLTGLAHLNLNNTSVSGDIANLSGLTGLVYLYLNNTSVSGDIANLSGLTSLAHLNLSSTSVIGDIANLSGLTNLVYLYLYSTSITYTAATLPTWNSIDLRVQNCGWPAAMVSALIIDLDTAGGTNGNLNVGPDNEPRTSASDAAFINLRDVKGWTITPNS